MFMRCTCGSVFDGLCGNAHFIANVLEIVWQGKLPDAKAVPLAFGLLTHWYYGAFVHLTENKRTKYFPAVRCCPSAFILFFFMVLPNPSETQKRQCLFFLAFLNSSN